MEIDKKFLIQLINNNSKNTYLFRLYKIYELCNKISDGKLNKHKNILMANENEIYTINNHVLSEQEKIIFEVKRIYKACDKIKNEKIKESYIKELISIVDAVKFNFNQKMNIKDNEEDDIFLVTKEFISILQAKLDLPVSFLYAASIAFLDIFETEYINSQNLLDTNLIKVKEEGDV